ncbi:hypothetical protein SLS57_012387 [Botryosphaeria dothidea]
MSQRAIQGRGNDQKSVINFARFFTALIDYKNNLQAIMIFCINTAFGSLPAYLPTILKAMGHTSLNAQGLSAPPYLAAYVICIATSYASDRMQDRGFFIFGFCCVGGAGCTLLATVSSTGMRYFSAFLVCAGVFPAVALTFVWVAVRAHPRRPHLPRRRRAMYTSGMWVCAGMLFFAACLMLVLSFSLR